MIRIISIFYSYESNKKPEHSVRCERSFVSRGDKKSFEFSRSLVRIETLVFVRSFAFITNNVYSGRLYNLEFIHRS